MIRLLAAIVLLASAPTNADDLIAVGIANRVPALTFTPRGSFRVIDQSTGEITRLQDGRAYKVEADSGGQLVLGPHLFSGPTRILPGSDGEFVLIGDSKYRGNLLFQPDPNGKTLTLIDEVGIEDYLYGVLPREMSPTWPIEALKAQAVVARTFALNNLGRYSAEGYDLTDDDKSQVYGGITIESERIAKAVKKTRGETLYYKGEPLQVYFHSSCGGRTASPEEIWGGDVKSPRPLRGVRERVCRYSPVYRWTAFFRTHDLLRAVQKYGWNVTRLTRVRVGERTRSGRARTFDMRVDRSWKPIASGRLRALLGASQLKSTMVDSIKARRGGFEFRGRGYGHGVGFCQWGARIMAERGASYRDILKKYFPGAKTVKWVD